MTSEEKAVLEAALAETEAENQVYSPSDAAHPVLRQKSAERRLAVRAYRKSLEPKPLTCWFVATDMQGPTGPPMPMEPCLHHMTQGRIDTQAVRGDLATLERIALLLNESEYKNLPGRA